MSDKLVYRMITGPDDQSFCARISQALQDGYQLHGAPVMAFNGDTMIVGQAVVLARFAQGPQAQNHEAFMFEGE